MGHWNNIYFSVFFLYMLQIVQIYKLYILMGKLNLVTRSHPYWDIVLW